MASGEEGALGGGASKFYKNNDAPTPSPISVIKIVKYCGVDLERGGGGNTILLKKLAPPLSVINIVIAKYCGVWGDF